MANTLRIALVGQGFMDRAHANAWGQVRRFFAPAIEPRIATVVGRDARKLAGELGVVAPLTDAGFTKDDVRRYAREHGLAAADKPASACLASRIPVGTAVTRERLARVAAAEAALRALGFRELRVRDQGERVHLEVGLSEFEHAQGLLAQISDSIRGCGFSGGAIDVYVPLADRTHSPHSRR